MINKIFYFCKNKTFSLLEVHTSLCLIKCFLMKLNSHTTTDLTFIFPNKCIFGPFRLHL